MDSVQISPPSGSQGVRSHTEARRRERGVARGWVFGKWVGCFGPREEVNPGPAPPHPQIQKKKPLSPSRSATPPPTAEWHTRTSCPGSSQEPRAPQKRSRGRLDPSMFAHCFAACGIVPIPFHASTRWHCGEGSGRRWPQSGGWAGSGASSEPSWGPRRSVRWAGGSPDAGSATTPPRRRVARSRSEQGPGRSARPPPPHLFLSL